MAGIVYSCCEGVVRGYVCIKLVYEWRFVQIVTQPMDLFAVIQTFSSQIRRMMTNLRDEYGTVSGLECLDCLFKFVTHKFTILLLSTISETLR